MRLFFDAVNYFVELVNAWCYNHYISKQRDADNTRGDNMDKKQKRLVIGEMMFLGLIAALLVSLGYLGVLDVKCDQQAFDQGHSYARLVGTKCYAYGNGKMKRLF